MERIVVAVDGSDNAALALGWAVREARAHAAKLEVVTVASVEVLIDPTWIVVPPVAEVDEVAGKIQAEAVASVDTTGVDVELFRPAGPPATQILLHAADADLLVMGSRGRGTFARRILGSVSHQVVTHVGLPVVVVPDAAPPIQHVVVGVDGSEDSKQALRWAWSEARTHEARLEVVVTYQWPTPMMVAPWVPPLMRPAQGEVRDRVVERVDHLVRSVTGGADVVRTVINGPPAQMLLERAEDADLLVVGSRGLGGFKGLLMGSVSQRCLTHAPCPVAVVPHDSGT